MNNPVQRAAKKFGICILGFWIFFALSLAQAVSTSPTFDEGFTILRGYAAWRTGYLVPIGHPPLTHWLSALGVVLEPNLPDPRELDGWYGDKYDDSSRDLMWKRGLNASRLVFLGRFPILLLGVILGAVTARWAKDLFGWKGALVVLALHALSPNLLAHSAVATTDLPVAAFFIFTLYAFFRYSHTPTLAHSLLTGLMLGLALAAKFSALLLLPTLPCLAALKLWSLRADIPALKRFILLGFGILILGFATLWANYGFAFQPYPLAQYIRELAGLTTLAGEGHTAYLFGQLSTQGWWYYHPVVFLVKTPLPLLALIAYSLWRMADGLWHNTFRIPHASRAFRTSHLGFGVWILGFSTLLYFAAASLSSLNVGYRYLLPILPLIHIFAASAASRQWAVGSRQWFNHSSFLRWDLGFGVWDFHSLFITSLFIVHFISTLSIAPHFLAYFNELVGPRNGYKVLADSNLDWGQDLPALARYLNGRNVNLSYFGQADPHYYGINYTALPGWPPPPQTSFAPADPAPGLYAISASNLVGTQLYDPNAFAYFRNLTPLTVVNHSIFVYEIPDHEPVTAFAQCAPPILERTDHLINRKVRHIVLDCENGIILPASPTLLLYPEGQSPLLDLGAPVFEWKRSDGTTYYRLYNSRTGTLSEAEVPTLPYSPIAKGSYLSLLAYDLTPDSLTLTWLVTEPAPPPVSIFVHFNWPDGALADAYDALGVPAEYWQKGDVIIQRHPISPDLPPGEYGITVGLYSLADGTRYSDIALSTYKK